MKLHILGCNGPFPSAGGCCSGYLLQAGKTLLQLDMGSGTLGRLSALCDPAEVDAVLFSHWHHDHSSDILPLSYRLFGREKPLHIYGPQDDSSPEFCAVQAESCFRLHIVKPGDSITIGSAQVQVLQARHPVPAVMYRIQENGQVFAYTGDTNTTDDLPALCENADMVLMDCAFTQSAWDEKKPHLSGVLAAQYARQSNAKQMVATHFNPLGDTLGLMKEIRTVMPEAIQAKAGMICSI